MKVYLHYNNYILHYYSNNKYFKLVEETKYIFN
jgi:hypothetical protein